MSTAQQTSRGPHMQGSCEPLCFTLQARARCHRRQSAGRVAAASSSARVDGRLDDMMRGVAQAAVAGWREVTQKSNFPGLLDGAGGVN